MVRMIMKVRNYLFRSIESGQFFCLTLIPTIAYTYTMRTLYASCRHTSDIDYYYRSPEQANTSTTRRASTVRRQSSVRYNRDQEQTPLLIDVPKNSYSQTRDVHIETPVRPPSFFRTLVRVYGLTLLKAHLCKVVCDVLTFVGPLLQRCEYTF